jgi:hypothetical protein
LAPMVNGPFIFFHFACQQSQQQSKGHYHCLSATSAST